MPRNGWHFTNAGWRRPLLLECFTGELAQRYSPLRLQGPASNVRGELEGRLAAAMALLDLVPGVGEAVRALVWSLIPVEAEGPDYDTGYSDPAVPFSIFIGAHPSEDQVPAIRLAEGVLHEAMHLQLSLIEDTVPLIAGSLDLRVSPWQKRPRPMQGLLHGLYVFRVVQDWLRAAEEAGSFSTADQEHAKKRLGEIETDCARLHDVAASPDLTKTGQMLARNLLGNELTSH